MPRRSNRSSERWSSPVPSRTTRRACTCLYHAVQNPRSPAAGPFLSDSAELKTHFGMSRALGQFRGNPQKHKRSATHADSSLKARQARATLKRAAGQANSVQKWPVSEHSSHAGGTNSNHVWTAWQPRKEIGTHTKLVSAKPWRKTALSPSQQ